MFTIPMSPWCPFIQRSPNPICSDKLFFFLLQKALFFSQLLFLPPGGGGGGGGMFDTSLYGLYRYVRLQRVWFYLGIHFSS